MACLTEVGTSHAEGWRSEGSLYPKSETAYFKRVYGSDHLNQLHDDHQEKAISRYARKPRVRELVRIQNQLSNLRCINDPEMTAPGRSAYSLALLRQNLAQYEKSQARSLRWNQHYQHALQLVSSDVRKLCGRGLHPISFDDVAKSGAIQRNLDKNAGYLVFETGLRSKGENLDEALKWCRDNKGLVLERGSYDLPLVISHRSSNSKPVSSEEWKWRCRIILMQDERALLFDGRYAIPFTGAFRDIPWGEGSMNHQEVESWIQSHRMRYTSFYSSDYSSFDVCQAQWLLEDVFYHIMKPCFVLGDEDEALFDCMVKSYIHKDIHGFDRVYHCDGCQLSGSLLTYALNTIVNQVIDTTVLLMQGCDLRFFKSLKCGDDNLTLYDGNHVTWDKDLHCKLIRRFFGINTTIGPNDYGSTLKTDPTFLSRTWTMGGARRPIQEVIWNLIFPERFRDYSPSKTHVSTKRAEALVLLSAVLEQPATMWEYFDVEKIYEDAQIRRGDPLEPYRILASMSSGFNDPWIRFKLPLMDKKRRGV
jgi:hypothetical protein